MRKVFDKGDIVRLCLNPVVGREQQGEARPVLVLSPKAFNALGVALIAPITQGGASARYAGFAVPLMGTGCQTQGVVIANMVRSVDLQARNATFVEKVGEGLVAEVVSRIAAVLEVG